MAKIYQKKNVTEEKDVFVKMVCDICGRESSSSYDWSRNHLEIDQTEIEAKINISIEQKDGFVYPGGGTGTEIKVDLCPECFRDKLIPWLRSQGVRIEEQDWDW